MACIRTGADVYLIERGEVMHGDLFLVGGTYILTTGGPRSECSYYPPTDAFHIHIATFHYEDCGSHSVAFTQDTASAFHYDGITFNRSTPYEQAPQLAPDLQDM